MEQLPIRRATVEEMERLRDHAILKYGEAFDALDEAKRAGARACISESEAGLAISDKARDALMAGNASVPSYRDDKRTNREIFIDEMTKTTDRAMWDHIILATDLERLMDRQARDEFRQSLHEDPAPATAQNVVATLTSLLGEAQTIFARGVANAFSGLDRRFKSHDGFKIGGRIILDGAFSEWGWNYHRRQDEVLRDVERAFCELDGDRQPERAAGIVGAIDNARGGYGSGVQYPIVVESEHFRVRIFKNGNAHLWFKRDDLVRKVNRVLADYYGEAIGEGSEVADVSDMGPSYHVTPARNFGLFETNEETAERLFDRAGYQAFEGKTVLEPSAGRGKLADMARSKGAARVQCVEIQHGLAAELRQKGHAVREGDFLAMTPADLGMFDVVVMNPPFDRGRDCDHVRHALQFLKPGGVLVAIMAAGVEFREDKRTTAFRAMIEKHTAPMERWGPRRDFYELPAGSFAHAGTMVNTVTLAVRKPAA